MDGDQPAGARAPAATVARPRATAWGDPSARELMDRLAADLADRAGFGICAMEVLRSDGMLEFVAISGDDPAAADLMGQASEFALMERTLAYARQVGSLHFIPKGTMPQAEWEEVLARGAMPDLPSTDDEGRWQPEDMLIATIVDRSGGIRGLVYLDVPASACRPDEAELLRIDAAIQLHLQTALSIVEREELSQSLRLSKAARAFVRAESTQQGLGSLLERAHTELMTGFRASCLQIELFDVHPLAPDPCAEGGMISAMDAVCRREARAAAWRAWQTQQVITIEPGRVWGDEELDSGQREALTDFMEEHSFGEMVIVPVGASGQALGMVWMARPPGGLRWTDAESLAAMDLGHDLGRAIVSARAIERERQAGAELQRLGAYRNRLLATVAHELKNPLGAIVGHLEMLEQHEHATEVRRSLDAMGRGTDRLMALVEDLSLLSKVGDVAEGEMKPVELGPLLVEVAELMAGAARQAQVRVELDVGSERIWVCGVAHELSGAFLNLLSNAVKYTDPGGIARLTLTAESGRAIVQCTDDGIGIDQADLDRLFTDFFRSTNVDALSRPGTGLGLTIVERVVSGHNGSIEVTSELGVGTTFNVVLPTVSPA